MLEHTISSVTGIFVGLYSILDYKEISRDIKSSREEYYKGKFIFGTDPLEFTQYLAVGIGIFFIITSVLSLVGVLEYQGKSSIDGVIDILFILFQLVIIVFCSYKIFNNIKQRIYR